MNLFDSIRSSLRDVEKFIDLCRALSCTCFHRPDGNYAQLENYEKGKRGCKARFDEGEGQRATRGQCTPTICHAWLPRACASK